MIRETGRSFRAVLQGLLAASEGKRVIVMCGTAATKQESFYRAQGIVFSMEAVRVKRNGIEFPNGGFLEFKASTEGSNLRGLRAELIVD